MRAAVIDNTNFFVVNVIELEEGADWTPPLNCFTFFHPTATIGMLWNGESLSDGPEDQIV